MPKLEELANKQKNFKKRDYRTYSHDNFSDKTNNMNQSLKHEPSAEQKTSPDILKENTGYQVIHIPTNKCKPWEYADRNKLEMGNIEQLANSLKANGQQEPALVRKITIHNEIEFEVIFGHRRWLACKLANIPLLAMVRDLDDKNAAIAQKEENENRENLSDYARAFNYKALLDNKVFSTQSELAAQLNISRSSLGDIMSYTKLPHKFISALDKPHELPKRFAVKISSLSRSLSETELNKLYELAPLIAAGKVPFNKLSIDLLRFSDVNEKNITNKSNIKQFKNSMSVNLFSSGYNQNKSPCFTFHQIISNNNLLPELEELVLNYLKEKTEGA